ncbi:hypothetical protein LTR27_004308 [Elasticomyces elasticus]|nr:hypothetical protein LTR27_004308 [Elasticomyces elasticus]
MATLHFDTTVSTFGPSGIETFSLGVKFTKKQLTAGPAPDFSKEEAVETASWSDLGLEALFASPVLEPLSLPESATSDLSLESKENLVPLASNKSTTDVNTIGHVRPTKRAKLEHASS